ncbi:TonB family protein [Roseibium sp.]|uniref:energy transducer TonB n=1 Tax=Roseibium sp. TaxID=1936156 RepID=UPI003B52D923
MTFPRFLAAGLALSFLFHGAGSAYFAKDPNEIEIAASQGGGVSVIGSLEDLVAGSKVEEITPEEPVEEIEPEFEPVEVVQAKPVEVAKAETPIQPQAQPIQAPVTPVVSETVPVVAGVTSIEAVTAETVTQPTPEPEIAEQVKTKEVTPPKPVKKVETLQQKPEEIADIKPDLEKAVEVTEPLNPIVKTPPVKPEPLIKEAKLVEKVKPVQEIKPVKQLKPVEKKKKKAKKKGSDRNSKKGGSQVTSRTANSNANGRADAKTNDGGTKAASNYKGKVFSKVRRAQRYPRKAERKKIQGTVHVSFTVAKTGSVSNIRVVRSSGHAILDKAAADQVRRAAPMPKFPKNIKKTKLAFKARIAFKSRR